MKTDTDVDKDSRDSSQTTGVLATLGISLSSGFASVYTEKVIKVRGNNDTRNNYSLAYMQVQLASASLIIIGCWALLKDASDIITYGLWKNFNAAAYVSVINSALGGLTVAAVLKFADAILKGYSTALSVVLTGLFSMLFFGTELNALYFLGMVNVVVSMHLYNNKALNENVC